MASLARPFALEHDDEPARQAEPADDGERRDRVGRRDDGAEHEADGQRHAEQPMRRRRHRAGREDDAAERQQRDRAQIEAEFAPAHGDAGRIDQRRQDAEQHQFRRQLDARQAGNERQRDAGDDEQDRRRGVEPPRDDGDDHQHGKQQQYASAIVAVMPVRECRATWALAVNRSGSMRLASLRRGAGRSHIQCCRGNPISRLSRCSLSATISSARTLPCRNPCRKPRCRFSRSISTRCRAFSTRPRPSPPPRKSSRRVLLALAAVAGHVRSHPPGAGRDGRSKTRFGAPRRRRGAELRRQRDHDRAT